MGSFWPEQFVYYCSAYDLMFRNKFCNKYKQIYIGSTDSMFSPLLTRTVVPEGRSYPYPKMFYTQEMRDEAVPQPSTSSSYTIPAYTTPVHAEFLTRGNEIVNYRILLQRIRFPLSADFGTRGQVVPVPEDVLLPGDARRGGTYSPNSSPKFSTLHPHPTPSTQHPQP